MLPDLHWRTYRLAHELRLPLHGLRELPLRPFVHDIWPPAHLPVQQHAPHYLIYLGRNIPELHASSGCLSAASRSFSPFFLPETLFPREPAMAEGKVIVTDGFGQMRVFEDLDAAAAAGYHPDQCPPCNLPQEMLS